RRAATAAGSAQATDVTGNDLASDCRRRTRFAALGHGRGANLFIGTDIFVLVLVVYDLGSRGRVHPTTLWGGAMVVGLKPLYSSPWRRASRFPSRRLCGSKKRHCGGVIA